MGEALEWYRENICKVHDHDHGREGELDCLLETLHRLRSGEDPLAILHESP